MVFNLKLKVHLQNIQPLNVMCVCVCVLEDCEAKNLTGLEYGEIPISPNSNQCWSNTTRVERNADCVTLHWIKVQEHHIFHTASQLTTYGVQIDS